MLPVYLDFARRGVQPSVARGWSRLEAAYVLAIAILMASRVPHFSGKSIGRVPREYVAVALIGVVAALLSIAYFPLRGAGGARRRLSRHHSLRDPALPAA